MRSFLFLLPLLLAPAWAVRVEWLSPRPGVYEEGRVVRLAARVVPEEGESVLQVRAVALPSGRVVLESRPGLKGGEVARYWDTTGFGGTQAVRLEVAYAGARSGTAYALLPLGVRGGVGASASLEAQGLAENLDNFIAQACRYIGFYDLASVRWLCTAHRTVRKAVRYWNQLGDMWEDFKNQAIYYGTGLALDWLGKSLGLHTLNPVVDQIDQSLDSFMSDIRRNKEAILRALARARARQVEEIEGWQPGTDYPYWGPEWWTRVVAGAVPFLGFEATQQSLKDLQRTAQLLENQSRVAQNVQNQQENTSLESTLQDLWDTLGAAWNFVAEAVSKGWASLTGGLSGASAESPGLPLPAPGPGGSPAPSPGGGLGQGQSPYLGAASGGTPVSGSSTGPTSPGISEQLLAEAQSAPSTREVTEVVVRGFAELIRLQAQDSFRAVQEMKNLAAQQALTVEQLAQVNQNLVELIRLQEKNQVDELRAAMSKVAAQAEATSARYVSAAEAMKVLAQQWRAQSGGLPGGGP
ncbi:MULTISPECIES: hypothetical protein [unclassified Thermus]|jgi:hypothetical protein|uniref:hypothetical protein n=1 Tax=unclassified Thermus TaxID=2619321 RepID=UPI002634CDFF|nr:hypothetical protein [Thermus sp.]MCX7850214.1 hypothetical protein [Thermus sp.]MDW8017229.1 hypothetical protein [Thermus sp.]MDW8357603.1 hypothetical protein [Thermus sp.]